MLEKEEEKNMLKILSYVSKINKNKKEMKSLFQELMKNLEISFQEEQTNIKYNEYYFNGIQIPKDIEFKEIGTNSFKVLWNIDKIKIRNIDNDKIKYRVEIRRENKNEKFRQVYEGSDSNCLIENLTKDTNYEIRICSIYNDLIGAFSKIVKIKTYKYDSIILRESNRQQEFLEKIFEWSGYSDLELLYRGTRDGPSSNIFHNKCNYQGPTITLFKNEKGNIFGGFASMPWTSNNSYYSAPDCFLFTLTNIYNTEPTKFPNKDTSRSVYHHADRGPCFGEHDSDLCIYENFLNKNSLSAFPERYQDVLGKGKSIFTGDSNNSNSNFKIQEIEVFRVFK